MTTSARTRSSRSFARDLAVSLSLTVTIVVVFAVGMSYVWSTQRSLRELNQDADATIESLALALSQPLWVINMEDVVQIGRVYSSRPNILYLRVEDEDEDTIFEGPPEVRSDTPPDTSQAVWRAAPIVFDGDQIGTVRLGMVNTTLVPQQQQYISTVVLFALVLAFVTVFVVFVLVRGLLVRPLQALSSSLHDIAEGEYHDVPHFGVREMDGIGRAFNKMVGAISARDRALLDANATLEAQVEARTEKLQSTNEALDQLTHQLEAQNEQLEQQNQTLEAQNAELERFTYTVSHDLKSPLVTIKAFLGFVRQAAVNDDMDQFHKDLNQINKAADHMHTLLHDLLQLSRVGRQVATFTLMPLGTVVDDVLRNLQGSIAEKDAEITVQADMPDVWGDIRRIQEVFQNLIENGLKFTRPGLPPRLSIQATRTGDWLTCVVRDEGTGIPERYHDTIFGLFERLDAETEGTGIGLALVKRIVELHGGQISVVPDDQEHGVAFQFTLPASPDAFPQSSDDASNAPPKV